MRTHLSAPLVVSFVGARALSTFGSAASALAVLVWVRELTGSDSAAALSMVLFALPTLSYPLIGQMVDRLNRITLLIASQLIGAGLTLCFLLVSDPSAFWLVYLIQLAQGVNAGLIAIAGDALLPQVATKSKFAMINGFLQSTSQVARLLAPMVGVLVYAQAGGIGAVVMLDVATYVVGILLLIPLAWRRLGQEASERTTEGVLASVREGLRLINTHRDVRLMVTTAGACILSIGLLSSVWYAVITAGLHREAGFAGVLATCQAVGGIGGGTIGVWFAKMPERAKSGCVLALSLVGMGAVTFLSGIDVIAAAGTLFMGLGGSILIVIFATVIQSAVPEDALGRVFGGANAITSLAQVGGLALGAIWLVAFQPVFQPVVVVAAVVVLPALVAALRIRRVDSLPGTATSGAVK
ncbi:MFS transporter [Nonomuraea sp. NPDC050536]|uniref:MFS transporter n=1 Tax=Nonomuraea sp. NPDC050536 TaxID=3364366 RepID=UPI0037C6BCDF